MSKGKILFQMTGSIAGFKACQVLSRLVQEGYEVETVASSAALKFIGEATLEGLTGRRVHTDTFAAGDTMSHIHLARWADLILLCPATANTINKMAHGVGDDLITTLFLAHDFSKPYVIAPAMNVKMIQHPATLASIEKLRAWGVDFINADRGRLACGETGEGRLAEPDEIFKNIESRLRQKSQARESSKSLRVLVTSGGTREPIDGVRELANISTGRTGATIADRFTREGHSVTLLRARGSATPSAAGLRSLEFTTFDNLERELERELSTQDYDVIIHAAAVSDYSVDAIKSNGRAVDRERKIESDDGLILRLKRNPKLIDRIRGYSRNPSLQVVAFKLTHTPDPRERLDAVIKLAQRARPDWIIQNDMSEIEPGGAHRFHFFHTRATGEPHEVSEASDKASAAEKLERLLTRTTAEGRA